MWGTPTKQAFGKNLQQKIKKVVSIHTLSSPGVLKNPAPYLNTTAV